MDGIAQTAHGAAPTHGAQHAERLQRLAEVAVKVGLGLRPGQELVMTAPLETVPLARAITEEAYKAGASLVTTFYADDAGTLARFAYAPDEAFDTAAGWLYTGMAEAYRNGAARLAIELAVDDVNADRTVLAGTHLNLLAQDTNCSGFLGTIEGWLLSALPVSSLLCCSS